MKAIVYTTESCRACKAAIALLQRLGVEVNVVHHSMASIQLQGLPTIVMNNKTYVGFNSRELERAVREVK